MDWCEAVGANSERGRNVKVKIMGLGIFLFTHLENTSNLAEFDQLGDCRVVWRELQDLPATGRRCFETFDLVAATNSGLQGKAHVHRLELAMSEINSQGCLADWILG